VTDGYFGLGHQLLGRAGERPTYRLAPMRKGVLVIVLILAVPSSALAALPKFRDKKIVPKESIAGVSLGMGIRKAISEWGGNRSCPTAEKTGTCEWSASTGEAALDWVGGKVDFINIQIPTNSQGDPVCRGPLMALKTSKGIGLCSTLTELAKKYPYPQYDTTGSGGVIGTGYHALYFSDSNSRFYDIYTGNVS
jgi:hypothetical protein